VSPLKCRELGLPGLIYNGIVVDNRDAPDQRAENPRRAVKTDQFWINSVRKGSLPLFMKVG